MLAVPPAILDLLHLEVGATVGLAVEGDRLVIAAQPRPRYTLAELLDATDADAFRTQEEQEWLESPAAGAELL